MDTLISFDEPMAPPPSTLGHPSGNLLDCSIATPIKNNKNSSTGSQHCTFDIFGGDVEMKSGSTGTVNNNDSTDWKTKCTDLQTKLKSLEFEISSEQTKCKDVTLKFENLKAELNSKTSECLKAENEVIKVRICFVCRVHDKTSSKLLHQSIYICFMQLFFPSFVLLLFYFLYNITRLENLIKKYQNQINHWKKGVTLKIILKNTV